MYRDPSLPALGPAEQRRQNRQSLWVFAGVSWLFAACVYYPLFEAWRIDDYLQSHPTQSVQALVTRVTQHTYRSCQITFEASFVAVESGRRFRLKSPGKSGYIGTEVAWAPCGSPGPIDLGRRIAVGDRVPALYAVGNPEVNRPVWTDYGQMVEQGWPVRWFFLGLAVVLTTLAAVAYGNRRTPQPL